MLVADVGCPDTATINHILLARWDTRRTGRVRFGSVCGVWDGGRVWAFRASVRLAWNFVM